MKEEIKELKCIFCGKAVELTKSKQVDSTILGKVLEYQCECGAKALLSVCWFPAQ